jgi:hypothetical protein
VKETFEAEAQVTRQLNAPQVSLKQHAAQLEVQQKFAEVRAATAMREAQIQAEVRARRPSLERGWPIVCARLYIQLLEISQSVCLIYSSHSF